MSFTPGSNGGEYLHKLKVSELPAHTHKIPDQKNESGILVPPDWADDYAMTTLRAKKGEKYWWSVTDYTGYDTPHNNIQPYIAVLMWRRIN